MIEEDEKHNLEKPWDTYIEKHKEVFGERPVLIDNVNHPSHYADGGIECIEAIEAQLTPEEYRGYLRGNCAKYLWRCNNKGHTKQDLEKCEWYSETPTTDLRRLKPDGRPFKKEDVGI